MRRKREKVVEEEKEEEEGRGRRKKMQWRRRREEGSILGRWVVMNNSGICSMPLAKIGLMFAGPNLN